MPRLLALFLVALVGSSVVTASAETSRRQGKGKGTPRPTEKSPGSTPRPTPSAKPSPTPRPSPTPTPTPAPARDGKKYGPNVALDPAELVEFPRLPSRIQGLIRAGMSLARRDLTYTFGSADPARGGMDCSGTIYYLLRSAGFSDVPRDSASQCAWLQKAGTFRPVATQSLTSPELSGLQPGHLLFWTGTYQTTRAGAVSHVMLYLGTEKRTGKPVMFGASDGRSYGGVQRYGVSVFDFRMPKVDPANPGRQRANFIGYGPIPGLASSQPADLAAEAPAPEPKPRPATPTPRPRKKG